MSWEKTEDGRLVNEFLNREVKAVEMADGTWAVLGYANGKRIEDKDCWKFDFFCEIPAYGYTSKEHAEEYIDSLYEIAQEKCMSYEEEVGEIDA